MPYTFSLEAVLRLRQHKQDAEERALAVLGAHRQQVEATLGRVRDQMLQWTEHRARETGRAGTGAAQLESYARLALLREAEAQLTAQLQEVQRRCLERQAVLLAAQRAQETLSELKRGQHDGWKAVRQRREQRHLEDLFLGRPR